jgi:hypothetical protein
MQPTPQQLLMCLDAFIRRTTNGTASDLQMNQISRSEYAAVPDKACTRQTVTILCRQADNAQKFIYTTLLKTQQMFFM